MKVGFNMMSYLRQDGLDADAVAAARADVGDVLCGLLARLRLAQIAAEQQQAQNLHGRIVGNLAQLQ